MTVPQEEAEQEASKYDPNAVIQHFDEYGRQEWDRLVQSPMHEVSLQVHTHYLEKHIAQGNSVLEIGAGPGRFTQVLSRLGAQVVVADISSVQLELNRRFAAELGFDQAVLDRQQVDICDLSQFESNSFDCVVVYGGPFSYVLDRRDQALSECLRVLTPGGVLLLSVMSLWGTIHGFLDGVLATPVSANHKIISTGDITPATYPERKGNFMHLFRVKELVGWLERFPLKLIDLSASNCLSPAWNEMLQEIKNDREKWDELLRMELEACSDPGCLSMGTHLIAVAKKHKWKNNMSRIANSFQKKPIFMPYFPLGYPDLETSIDVIEALARNGADLIEVGLSFSDPLADGPVIQQATQIALEKGITIKKSLEAVKEIRSRGVDIPLVLMGYYNPMLAYGLEKFVRDALDAGADGFIVPDLPVEEAEDFTSATAGAGTEDAPSLPLPLIQMLAPTTPNERMEKIARNAQGFIYLVSVTGVTGERKSISEGLGDLIARVREHATVPVCVGFGISTPQQAKEVGGMADGVIVGTACVRMIGGSETPVETAKEFAREFQKALKDGTHP